MLKLPIFSLFLSLCWATTTSDEPFFDGSWIVQFKPGGGIQSTDSLNLAASVGIATSDVVRSFDYFGQNVLVAKLTEEKALQVEKDSKVSKVAPDLGLKPATIIEQLNPPNYNLPRISHRQRGNFTAYRFDDTAGMGTCIYVLDTGLNARPEEFGTRSVRKATIVTGVTDADTDGHGTHVAGTAGSKSYGAAKNARIYAVKIFDNSGSAPVSAIMQAAAFVVKDATTETANCPKGFVVNLSLQFDTTQSTAAQQVGQMINDAISVLINNTNPVFNVFTAAGNMNKPASVSAPGNTPNVCNIGNIDMADFVYRGRQEDEGHVGASNYGSTVKLFAPGTAILSTAITNTPPPDDPALGAYGPFGNFSTYMTGTSMASPLVAGIAATILGRVNDKFNTTTMCNRLINNGTQASIQNLADPQFANAPVGPNVIAYNENGA